MPTLKDIYDEARRSGPISVKMTIEGQTVRPLIDNIPPDLGYEVVSETEAVLFGKNSTTQQLAAVVQYLWERILARNLEVNP